METGLLQSYLNALGAENYLSWQIIARPSYRGSIYCHRFIRAEKSGRAFLIFEKDLKREFDSVKRVQAVIEKIPAALKIVELIPVEPKLLVVLEEAEGFNLWEIEDPPNLPTRDELEKALRDIVERLRKISWVHGDLRPWNIFFEPNKRKFGLIDWWLMEQGETSKDEADAKKILALFDGKATLDEVWPQHSMTWNPSWVKRSATPQASK